MNSTANCHQLLGPDGPFATNIADFKVRHGQREMAALIQETLDEQGNCVIEAPSGLGKTWAYLVPILLSGKKAVISTGSHYLQGQLYQRDIPAVQRQLGITQRVAILKGRHNYLCPYYVKKYLAGEKGVASKRGATLLSASSRALLSHILQVFRETDNGDLSRIKPKENIRSYLSCADEECLGKLCPDYSICPLMKARKVARHADVVIINHNLLLSFSASTEETFLSSAETILIDEAHRLLEIGQNMAGERISSRVLRRFFRDLRLAANQYAQEDAVIIQFIHSAERWLAQLITEIPPVNAEQLLQHRAIVSRCRSLFEQLTAWFTVSSERAFELKKLAVQASQIERSLKTMLADEGLCWLQVIGSGFIIKHSPVDTLDSLQPLLGRYNKKAWIFTSATLSAGLIESVQTDISATTRMLKKLGLEKKDFYRFLSPFNFDRQARLFLGDLTATPEQSNYYSEFTSLLNQFIRVCPGRVLVLFSSFQALEKTAVLLTQMFSGMQGAPHLLVQKSKRDAGVDNYGLVEAFRGREEVVLLATGSFWEGVDLSGAKLSAVVIDKLPFPSPLEPILKLRSDYLERHGVDSFREFMLPEAMMRLRQGCGRLLRREDDKGVIMLADPRVRYKEYGQLFMQSLEPITVCSDLDEVERFYTESINDG